MDMSIPYEETGRVEQKARTRSALVVATRELLAAGMTPTVEEAAKAAAISRTTAYRYFPNQRSLLLAAHPMIEFSSLLGDDPPSDPEERLDLTVRELGRLIVEVEPELRTMLRLSLESDAPPPERLVLRQGRAIGWLEEALAPLRDDVPADVRRRLVLAIRAACGIEALVWLTDVAGLSREEAVELMRWSARALFRSAVAETSSMAK
jgi:hypothetical protein